MIRVAFRAAVLRNCNVRKLIWTRVCVILRRNNMDVRQSQTI